jgi:hypothetical protein
MFCFETAMKALYWSILVYRYEQGDSDQTRDVGVGKVRLSIKLPIPSFCPSSCFSARVYVSYQQSVVRDAVLVVL